MTERKEPGAGIIVGRQAVSEALRAGRPIEALYVAKGERTGSLPGIIAKARELGVPVKETDPRKLAQLSLGEYNQGVVAVAAVREYAGIEDILKLAEARGEPPFILVCDGIEDPQNLGAIIRTAECAGAHGVVIPKRRSAGLSPATERASAGAVEHLPVARVNSIASFLDYLKERGVWVYCADMDGRPYYETDFSGPAALVIGAEGSGLGRLVREKADFTVSIPVRGKIDSLNASVAAGVICCEISRQRAENPARRDS